MDFIKQIGATVVGSALTVGVVILLLGKYFDAKVEKSRHVHERQMRELDAAIESRDRVGLSDLEAIDSAWQALAECVALLSRIRFKGYLEVELVMQTAAGRLRQRLGAEHELTVAYARGAEKTTELAREVSQLELERLERLRGGSTDDPLFRAFSNALKLSAPRQAAREALEAFENTMRPYTRGEKTP